MSEQLPTKVKVHPTLEKFAAELLGINAQYVFNYIDDIETKKGKRVTRITIPLKYIQARQLFGIHLNVADVPEVMVEVLDKGLLPPTA